jgi:hypothetical protein
LSWPLLTGANSAIGTPLDWPEAKDVAAHVRSWGIEVCLLPMVPLSDGLVVIMYRSNYLPFGATQRARREMRFFGETR